MKDFAIEFRRRFDAAKRHGSRAALAQATGLHVDTLSRWGKAGQFPTIQQAFAAASILEVSACWLAFGHGPQDPHSAQAGFTLGEQLEQHSGLRELVAYYTSLSASERAAMLTVLKIPVEPKLVQTSGGNETSAKRTVASPPAPPYAGESSTDDAAEWVRGLGKRMKRTGQVDLSKAEAPISRGAIPEIEERAAADHLRTYVDGGTGPIIAETEPTEIKYPRASHFTLKVTGRSMYPTIFEGDRIIVEKTGLYLPPMDEDNPVPSEAWRKLDREIVVAIKNEDTEAYVKRVEISKHKRSGWRILLRSDNPAAKSIEIDREDSLLVVGIVREIVRDPKNVG